MTLRGTSKTLLPVVILLVACTQPAAAVHYVHYDYTVNAPGDVVDPISGAEYLYDETFVEGEFSQTGDNGAGNYGHVKFLADIEAGRVFSYVKMVGVQLDVYEFYGGSARVEFIEFLEEFSFDIEPGDYPDGLYASVSGRIIGHYGSELGAGAQIQGYVTLGSAVYDTGILSVGVGETGTGWIDEPFTVVSTVVPPGSHYAVPSTVYRSLIVRFHRSLCWAVEYNTGSGYVIGTGENDFYGGIQITDFTPPDGVSWSSSSGTFMSGASPAEDLAAAPPVLLQNSPNPFNPSTTIAFELPEPAPVTLRIFGLDGRLVRTLRSEVPYGAGRHAATWDGRDDAGRAVSSGAYLYRLRSGMHAESRRMILIR